MVGGLAEPPLVSGQEGSHDDAGCAPSGASDDSLTRVRQSVGENVSRGDAVGEAGVSISESLDAECDASGDQAAASPVSESMLSTPPVVAHDSLGCSDDEPVSPLSPEGDSPSSESTAADMGGASVPDPVQVSESAVPGNDAQSLRTAPFSTMPRRSAREKKPPDRLVLRFFTEAFCF